MKKVLHHRLTGTLAVTTLIIASMTFVGGPKYPLAFGALWVAYAIAVAFGVAVIRRDTKSE